MTDKRTLTEVVRAYGLESLASSDRHPSLGELARYAGRRLDQKQREDVMEHLVLCARCSGRVLELSAVQVEPSERGWFRSWPSFRGMPLYVTATLAVVCVAAILWGVGLRDRLRTLESTAYRASAELLGEVSVLEFTPRALSPTRGTSERQPVRAPTGVPLVLILHTTEELTAGSYSVEVRGPDGRLLHERRSVEPGSEGSFVQLLPTGLEPPGRYTVRLVEVEDGERLELESFELEVADGG